LPLPWPLWMWLRNISFEASGNVVDREVFEC
jgi:hypothetical protein